MITLFDLQNGVVVPTVHCHTIECLKRIMEEHPDDYLKIYQYIFYMTCPNEDLNPYRNIKESEKEEVILKQIQGDFSVDDENIIEAIEECKKLYETPTLRAYNGAKIMLDKISDYLASEAIVGDSKAGNGVFILNAMKNLTDMRKTYRDAEADLQDEQKARVRGDRFKSYDQ